MPGTLCLTFDDLFVAHDTRVTFCVSHLHMAFPGWRRQNRLPDLKAFRL
jgi:DNA-binding cell septation regulator SpoVG